MSTAQTASRPQESCRATGITRQLVSFRLAQEEYAIEITRIQEIILPGKVTRVPRAPDFIKGLIHLRGVILPVVDLRKRFGLPETENTDDTRIIVVNASGKTMGMVVDAVNEVLRITPEQIAPPPPTVAGPGREYLVGLVRLEHRLLILLEIEKILATEETAAVESATADAPDRTTAAPRP